jgi:hypothetical protein
MRFTWMISSTNYFWDKMGQLYYRSESLKFFDSNVLRHTNKWRKILLTWKRLEFCLPLANKILWENTRYIITVRDCVHCAKGRKGQRQFPYHLFSWITGIKSNMVLINFWGIIAKLGWSLSAISNREVLLWSVESLLSANQCVPSARVKVGDSYRLQGSVIKKETVLSTELPAAVDHGWVKKSYRL